MVSRSSRGKPLLERGEPAAHGFDRGLRWTGGDDAVESDFHRRFAAGKEHFLHPFARAHSSEHDVDIAARLEAGA